MRVYIRTVLFILLGVQLMLVCGQPLSERYEIIPFSKTASGTQSVIYSLLEDPQGYIWIATQDGLYRYDGFAFTSLVPPEDPQGQQGLQVYKMHIKEDRLYAASSRGLQIIDLNSLVSKTVSLARDEQATSINNLVFDIQEDHTGKLWVITPAALHQLSYPHEHIQQIDLPDTLFRTGRTLSARSRLTCLPHGELWIEVSATNRKDLTLRFDSTTHQFSILDLVPGNTRDYIFQLNPQNIAYVVPSQRPQVGTIDPNDGIPQPIELPSGFLTDNPVISVGYYNPETMLLTVRGKKWLFELHSRKLIDPGWPIYLKDPQTGLDMEYNLYRTRDGMALGYSRKGLIRFIDEQQLFKPYHDLDSILTMRGNPLSQIWNNDSIQWACHFGDGGVLLNAEGNLLQHVYLGMPRPFEMSNYWWNISQYSKDTFWMGTSGGLFWYKPDNQTQGRINRSGLPDGLLTKGILTQFLDSKNELWMGIGSGNGAVRWSPDRKTIKYYPVGSGGLPFRYPKIIAEDSHGDLWMGCQTGGGLVRWDRDQDTFEVFRAHEDSIFTNELIESIIIDPDDGIYFGTLGSGLFKFNPRLRTFLNWSKEEGLSNNYVDDLEWDQNGNLWIATRNGLNKLELSSNKISVFYTIHGLPANRVDFIQKQTDSTFFIFTSAGTRVVNPDHLTSNPMNHPINISHLEINGEVKNELLQSQPDLRLNYRENSLTFGVSQVNLRDGLLNQYEYRLVNRDSSWLPLNAGNRLELVGISPGHYQIQFRVCNNNQCRSTDIKDIRILPPFWRSIWFYLLLVILFTGIIYGFARLRIRNIIRQQNLRNQISADLHDDIGSSLSSIRFMTEMISDDRKDPDQRVRLEAIKEEIEQISQNLEEIIWYIKPTSDTFEEIHLKLRRFSTEILESKGIQLHWQQSQGFEHIKLSSQQKRDYFLLFKEIINNAAKHSQATRVDVSIQLTLNQLKLQISDDGVGFHPDQAVTTNGMHTMRTRAVRLGGHMHIDSLPDQGTQVNFQFTW